MDKRLELVLEQGNGCYCTRGKGDVDIGRWKELVNRDAIVIRRTQPGKECEVQVEANQAVLHDWRSGPRVRDPSHSSTLPIEVHFDKQGF